MENFTHIISQCYKRRKNAICGYHADVKLLCIKHRIEFQWQQISIWKNELKYFQNGSVFIMARTRVWGHVYVLFCQNDIMKTEGNIAFNLIASPHKPGYIKVY